MPTLILTGATGNLGSVVTQIFLDKGWNVHAACINIAEAKRLPEHPNCRHSIGNLSDEKDVENLFSDAGTVYAVVHLVGGIKSGEPIATTSQETFENMITINTRTTFLVLRQAMRVLQSNGGSIVTIGAKAALHPETNKSVYAAAKAAVINLTLTAAEEGKQYGIRSNCIVPGIILTPANLEWASDGEEKNWTPPQDIAEAIYALCTDAGKGISGSILPMYGKLPT
ncbi:MAG: SDR family oxidoreductase [Ignavibacteriae bacterium]|nr:SDR family oxidoreductase [Ignavibacteriota bacterium]